MRKVLDIIKYFSDKRFSTVAGTLVYFLLMSIAPFLFWLTLVGVNMQLAQSIASYSLFDGVRPVLRYLRTSAESAAGSAGIIFLVTSLYSSTNFFYHLRRSGEIIYGSAHTKGGIKLRIISLLLIFACIALLFVLATLAFAGRWLLTRLLPVFLSELIISAFLTVAAFFVAVVLNLFACPYKIKFSEVVCGSLLTTALWIVFAVGFSVYLNFASPERLYGKLAFLMVFLLWCYIMMSCFVIGVILNGSFHRPREYKKL